MDKLQKKAIYDDLTEEGSKAYLKGKFKKALTIYNEALKLTNELKIKKMNVSIIKYMICCCLLNSYELDDLSEAVIILQNIEKCIKQKFPAVYCLLAKAHCKLYRFEQALHHLNEGETILNKNGSLEPLYIPGTNVKIQQNKNDKDWINVKKECSAPHVPHAKCKLMECKNVTKPYFTPNTDIYLNDPAHNGIVTVNCNKKKAPCVFNYHPCCWKFKKEKIFPMHMAQDIEFIGNKCFTPNCKTEDGFCIISFIQIKDKYGNITTEEFIKSPSFSSSNTNLHGAIRKQTDYKKYAQQKLVVKEELGSDISSDCSELNEEKQFLLSFFYYYIQNNVVNIRDVHSKFDEINQDLTLKDIDIVTFLLQTNKIKIVDNDVSLSLKDNITINNDKKTCNGSFEDINEIYDELVNSDDLIDREIEPSEDNTNNIHKDDKFHNKKSMQQNNDVNIETNTYSTHFKSPLKGISNKKSFECDEKQKLLEITKNSMDAFGEIAMQNAKLENYTNQLEDKLEKIKYETQILKEELKDKDFIIESLKKEQEDYLKKIEMCESLYETVENFQLKYENVNNDNVRMKEQIINLIEEKKEMEQKLCKGYNTSDFKRHEILKIFKHEFKIQEDCINSEWQKKISELETTLQIEVKEKVDLCNNFLNYQYSSNRYILYRYVDQYTMLIKIINSINVWMENIIDIKLFENSEWCRRKILLQEIINDQQIQYTKLLEALNSNSLDTFKNISLSLPTIPNILETDLEGIIQNTLITWSIVHYNFMKRIHITNIPFNKNVFIEQIHQMLKMALSNQNNLNFDSILQNLKHQSSQTSKIKSVIIPEEDMHLQPSNQELESSEQKQHEIIDNSKQSEDNILKNEDNTDIKVNSIENFSETLMLNVEKKLMTSKILKNENAVNSIEEGIMENNYFACKNDENKTQNISLHMKAIDNVQCEQNNVTSKEKKPQKIGLEVLVEILLHQYPGALEAEIIEVISDIRKKFNNTLTGMSISQIIKESEKPFLARQAMHILNDETDNELSSDTTESEGESINTELILPRTNTTKNLNEKNTEEEDDAEFILSMTRKQKNRQKLKQTELDSTQFENNNVHWRSNKKCTTLVQNKKEKNKKKASVSLTSNKNVNRLKKGRFTNKKCTTVVQKNKQLEPLTVNNFICKTRSTSTKTWDIIPEPQNWNPSNDETECSICMGELKKMNSYVLSCGHFFHAKCIKPWMKADSSCPNCRCAVTDIDEFPPL